MGSYEDDVRTLEVELGRLEETFGDLSDEQWQAPTKLRPLDETQPHWTVFELAGHFDISIGLTVMLMAEPQSGQVGRDRTPSRVVEAVVHGIDLTDAIGREPIATQEGVAVTAGILDDLLARKTVPGRPADLGDDLAWVRAASGRADHPDPRLPLIG